MRSQGALGFTEIRFVSISAKFNISAFMSCGSKKGHLNVRILTSTSVLLHTENITVEQILIDKLLSYSEYFPKYTS
jgi:hypothetical protein